MHVPACFVFRALIYLNLQICGSRFFIFFKVWLLFVFYCLIGFLSVGGSVCMHVLIFAYLHVHVLS